MTTEIAVDVRNYLIEEIEAIVVTKYHESQQAKLDLFWLTGETLRRYEREQKIPITHLVEACARDARLEGKQMGERNLFWSIKLYDHYPDREFPGGKAASVTKIKKLLTDNSAKEEKQVDIEKVAGDIIQKYGYDTAKAIAQKILVYNN